MTAPARSPEPVDLPAGRTHGTPGGYRAGCGCPPCRDAKRRNAAIYKARRKAAVAAARAQLSLFEDDTLAGEGLLEGRQRLPHLPPMLVIADLAHAMAHPEERWWERGRCRGRADLALLFHEEVEVQIRHDGTKAYCAPGDFVDESYQAWCAACPVWHQCIADVMRTEPHQRRSGWWGSSPTQRRHIRDELGLYRTAVTRLVALLTFVLSAHIKETTPA